MKIILPFFFAVFFILITPNSSFASNLLQNNDFETGNVDSWTSSGGSSTATASAELIHGGNYSIKVQHDKTSYYGFQQAVSNIEGSKYYKISGYAAANNSETAGYFIRLAWYTSSDATGSQMNTSDGAEINQTNSSWLKVEETFQAPSSAKSTKVRLVLKSKTGGSLASVYFDDLILEQVADPTSTPAPTPIITDPPDPPNTPTPIKTPTPTKILTPTVKPTIKPSPTSTSDNPNLPVSILGTSSATVMPTISQDSVRNQSSESPLTKLFLIGGGIILLLSGGLFYTFLAKRKQEQV